MINSNMKQDTKEENKMQESNVKTDEHAGLNLSGHILIRDTETGEEFKFQSKDFISLMDENTELREQIYKKICEETILQYKSDTLDIDNMEIDTRGAGVNE